MRLFDTKLISFLCTILISSASNIAHANKDVYEKHASDRSLTLDFAKGESTLSALDQTKLKNLVSKIGLENIDRVEIAAWSDLPFPMTGTDLPETDRNLANMRLNNIKDYLQNSCDVSSTKTYNMAETSNWVANTLRTDDAKLKSIFRKDVNPPMVRKDFDLIRKNGGVSKAVVVVITKLKKQM